MPPLLRVQPDTVYGERKLRIRVEIPAELNPWAMNNLLPGEAETRYSTLIRDLTKAGLDGVARYQRMNPKAQWHEKCGVHLEPSPFQGNTEALPRTDATNVSKALDGTVPLANPAPEKQDRFALQVVVCVVEPLLWLPAQQDPLGEKEGFRDPSRLAPELQQHIKRREAAAAKARKQRQGAGGWR